MIILALSGKQGIGLVKHGKIFQIRRMIIMTRYNDMLHSIQEQIIKTQSSCDSDDSPIEC